MQRSSLVFDGLLAGIVWVGWIKDHLDRCGTCRHCSGILTSQRGTGLTLDSLVRALTRQPCPQWQENLVQQGHSSMWEAGVLREPDPGHRWAPTKRTLLCFSGMCAATTPTPLEVAVNPSFIFMRVAIMATQSKESNRLVKLVC